MATLGKARALPEYMAATIVLHYSHYCKVTYTLKICKDCLINRLHYPGQADIYTCMTSYRTIE